MDVWQAKRQNFIEDSRLFQARQREDAINYRSELNFYKEAINSLILEHELISKSSNNAFSSALATALTKAAASELDDLHRGKLIRYLSACRVIEGPEGSMRIAFSGINFGNTLLPDSYLREINLSQGTFVDSDFQNSDLIKSNLSGTNFKKSNFSHANLLGSNLFKADLGNCCLHGTIFEKSDLFGVTLEGADISGADFRDAKNLKAEQIMQAKNWEKALIDEKLMQEIMAGLNYEKQSD